MQALKCSVLLAKFTYLAFCYFLTLPLPFPNPKWMVYNIQISSEEIWISSLASEMERF